MSRGRNLDRSSSCALNRRTGQASPLGRPMDASVDGQFFSKLSLRERPGIRRATVKIASDKNTVWSEGTKRTPLLK